MAPAILLFASSCTPPQDNTNAALERVLADTRALVELGPRAAGQTGADAAAEFIGQRFQDLGVDAVEQKPVWLPRQTAESSLVWLSAEGPRELDHDVMAFSDGIPGASAPLVDVGAGAAADFAATDVQGAVVLLRSNPASYLGQIYDLAVAGGAIAVVVDSNIKTDEDLRLVRVVWKTDEHESPTGPIPAVSIGRRDADLLRAALGAGPVMLEVGVSSVIDRVTSAHVVGRVVGSEHPERVVAVLAHSDSWFMGANDDAVSVATLFELARSFKEKAPRFTWEFVAIAGEEIAYFGSGDYVRQLALEDKPQPMFAVTLEVLAPRSPTLKIAAFDPFRSPAGTQLLEAFQDSGLGEQFDLQMRGGELRNMLGAVPAGQEPLWTSGVPGLMLVSVGYPEFHSRADTVEAVDTERLTAVLTGLQSYVRALDALDVSDFPQNPDEWVSVALEVQSTTEGIAGTVHLDDGQGNPVSAEGATLQVQLLNEKSEVLAIATGDVVGDAFNFTVDGAAAASTTALRAQVNAGGKRGDAWYFTSP